MTSATHTNHILLTRPRFSLRRICLVMAMLLTNLLPISPAWAAKAEAPLAQTTLLSLNVISARTELNAPNGPVAKGDPVVEYQYMINVDNTGNPNQATRGWLLARRS